MHAPLQWKGKSKMPKAYQLLIGILNPLKVPLDNVSAKQLKSKSGNVLFDTAN